MDVCVHAHAAVSGSVGIVQFWSVLLIRSRMGSEERESVSRASILYANTILQVRPVFAGQSRLIRIYWFLRYPWIPVKYAGKTLEKCLPQKATSSSSVTVKTDMSMGLDSSFSKTL